MATTGTNIITSRVRLLLNDTSTQTNVQRWIDATLILFLNDGVTLITSLRPDSKIAADGTIRTITALSALTDSISIDDKWMLALVSYICSQAHACPGKGRLNLDAAKHFLNQFNDLVKAL